ncbi:MAG: hypothetical protein HFG87_02130 [Dorea sp.]|nr:hypothetical protein [Dorea sp.]
MNFNMIQSLNSYTRNMEMQMKWQKRKDSSDFTADGKMKLDLISRQAEEIRQAQADGSAKLSSQIRSKLANGKKLTIEEMEYLQKNDPQLYQKVKSIEAEQKNYENELKRCKTKEEVQRVRTNHAAASLSTVNNIKNNPNIPEGKKLELIWQEHMKNQALEEVTKEFVESGKYAKLPTEAEKAEAEKELKEAKEAELGIEDPAEEAEEKDKAEADSETDSTKEDRPADSIKEARPADGAESALAESQAGKVKKAMVDEAVQSSRAALQKHEMTRMEAETTPEALKVKRAKARAAYEGVKIELPKQLMDVKVK